MYIQFANNRRCHSFSDVTVVGCDWVPAVISPIHISFYRAFCSPCCFPSPHSIVDHPFLIQTLISSFFCHRSSILLLFASKIKSNQQPSESIPIVSIHITSLPLPCSNNLEPFQHPTNRRHVCSDLHEESRAENQSCYKHIVHVQTSPKT